MRGVLSILDDPEPAALGDVCSACGEIEIHTINSSCDCSANYKPEREDVPLVRANLLSQILSEVLEELHQQATANIDGDEEPEYAAGFLDALERVRERLSEVGE